jgi:hypothetical protein
MTAVGTIDFTYWWPYWELSILHSAGGFCLELMDVRKESEG